MFVCICNALSDRDVRKAIRGGARTPKQIYAALGVEPQCGKCAPEMRCHIAQQQPPKLISLGLAAIKP